MALRLSKKEAVKLGLISEPQETRYIRVPVKETIYRYHEGLTVYHWLAAIAGFMIGFTVCLLFR